MNDPSLMEYAHHEVDTVSSIGVKDIVRARAMLRDIALHTPLIRAKADDRTLLFKPESIQPYGSFKVRCANFAVGSLSEAQVARGLYTASAGNFGQGVAAAAARRGVAVRTYAPDGTARTKLAAMRALGSEVIEVPFARWWEILSGSVPAGEDAHMVHPCRGRDVLIGNATIGAEVIEDAPDVDAIFVPYGGGGLALGVAAAIRVFAPHIEVIACEAASSTPLTSAFAAGKPVAVTSDMSTFIDGIGGAMVLPSSWAMLRRYISATTVVDDEDAAATVARMFRTHRLLVEGAGAVAVTAARDDERFRGKMVVAVVSGGNIDEKVVHDILARH